MIELRNVTKSYRTRKGRHCVLKDLSLRLPSALNIGILGRNGAGKSTLLRIIGGIDYPDTGEVIADESISWPLALTGGFQGSMSGRENAKFVCRVYGSTEDELYRRIAFVHEFSELGDYFDMPVKTYSSGMRGRLGFALSIGFGFDVYLVDEVTAVGDQAFRRKCAQAFRALRGRSSLIMVSHNVDTLRRTCDIGLLLRDGQAEIYDRIDDAIRAYRAG